MRMSLRMARNLGILDRCPQWDRNRAVLEYHPV